MSQWGSLEATFKGGKYCDEEHIREGMPTGSESGPDIRTYDDGQVHVDGRLRDVSDNTSPAVLAWFVGRCAYLVDEASLMWEVDRGPRYRYEWRDGGLVKLRGVLDG